MSGTGRGTHKEVPNGLKELRDVSQDSRRGPGRVGGPSRRSGTGRETLGMVRDGSGDTRGGLGRVAGLSGRSGMGRGTHKKVPDKLREIRDGS